VPPSTHMLVVRNDDRPGVIGIVGTALGTAGVSISSMAVGPSPESTTAMMVISTATPAPDNVVDQLRGDEGILDIHRVTL
jgi:D-3-phosphoglycerate dehydrogenase / 2-oxoglutarate reductase